jgi:hypothetical protein
MNEKKEVVTTRASGKEIAWYVVSGLFLTAGLTLAILSIVGDYIGAGNWIKQAEKSMVDIFKWNTTWRFYGLVLLIVGVIIGVITLVYNARKAERVAIRTSSRSERVQINLDAINKAQQVEESHIQQENENEKRE